MSRTLILLAAPAMALLPVMGRAAQAGGTPDAGHLLRMIMGLVLVIGLIVALAWLLRRLNSGRFGSQGPVRVLGGSAVGQRERVVLIQVGEQQLLIGVAPGSVRTLHLLDTPVSDAVSRPTGATGDGFLKTFMQQLGKPS